MSSLPVILILILKLACDQTIMCYLGIGDTFTPAHKDSSASTGYNLMLHTSSVGDSSSGVESDDDVDDLLESGEASSFWFMTQAEDAAAVSKYFIQKLGQTLDLQAHYTTLQELAKGGFKVRSYCHLSGTIVLTGFHLGLCMPTAPRRLSRDSKTVHAPGMKTRLTSSSLLIKT